MERAHYAELTDCTDIQQALAERPSWLVHGLMILLVALLAVTIAFLAIVETDLVVRCHGRVRPVAPAQQVFAVRTPHGTGRVVEVFVDEGSQVKRNQLLARLDTTRLDQAIESLERKQAAANQELQQLQQLTGLLHAQEESASSKADAELELAKREYEQACADQQAQLSAAERELGLATDRLQRHERLSATQAISKEALIESQHRVATARAQVDESRRKPNRTRIEIARRAQTQVVKEFAVRHAELHARHTTCSAQIALLAQELAALRADRDRAELRAPIDGIVVSGRIQPDSVVELDRPLFEVAATNEFRVEAQVAGDEMGLLREGMPVKLKLDAFDYQQYGTVDGTLSYIAPDSSNSNAAAEAYVIRVDIDRKATGKRFRGELKLGLGATTEIVVTQRSLLSVLLRKFRGSISLG